MHCQAGHRIGGNFVGLHRLLTGTPLAFLCQAEWDSKLASVVGYRQSWADPRCCSSRMFLASTTARSAPRHIHHIPVGDPQRVAMSDADSIGSFPSPSASPTLATPQWSVVGEGEWGPLPIVEDTGSIGQYDERASSLEHDVSGHRRPGLLHGADPQSAAGSTSEVDLSQRGRTHRKQSSSTQSFVCVVAWLIRPAQDDAVASRALEKVQEIRRRFDNAYRRWAPHVTLIPPFVVPFSQNADSGTTVDMPTSAKGPAAVRNGNPSIRQLTDPYNVLALLSKRIDEVCQTSPASPLIFDEVSKFTLRRYDTYHLRPGSTSAGTATLIGLQEALSRALPEAVEFARGSSSKRRRSCKQHAPGAVPSGVTGAVAEQDSPPVPQTEGTFKPHLTLGQATRPDKGKEIQALSSALLDPNADGPLQVNLGTIQLMFKPVYRSGPYDVFQEFHLKPSKLSAA